MPDDTPRDPLAVQSSDNVLRTFTCPHGFTGVHHPPVCPQCQIERDATSPSGDEALPTVDDLSVALQRGGALSSHFTYHDLARCVLAALRDGRDDLGAPDEHRLHVTLATPSSAPDAEQVEIDKAVTDARTLGTGILLNVAGVGLVAHDPTTLLISDRSSAPDVEGLDVERLARALDASWEQRTNHYADAESDAAIIAMAYRDSRS
jgi:hypothetical protein